LEAISYVEQLQLIPHPEGGYYREMYRSGEWIPHSALPNRFQGDRVFATGIYFLITGKNFSAFHRIASDELWHHYAGGGLQVHVIHPDGRYELIRLGNRIAEGEAFQAAVPAGAWFASECAPDAEFALVGCTVAPGFDFADVELAKADQLSAQFPAREELIRRLCRG
jgi:hypothetical protein